MMDEICLFQKGDVGHRRAKKKVMWRQRAEMGYVHNPSDA